MNDSRKLVPLGIMPKWIWNEIRKEELVKAIKRYRKAGVEVPQEWIVEYEELDKDASQN